MRMLLDSPELPQVADIDIVIARGEISHRPETQRNVIVAGCVV